MCNSEPGEKTEMVRKLEPRSLTGVLCLKCNIEKAVLYLRDNDIFCKTCFIPAITHKFRASIGKMRLVKTGDKVLLSYSGGQCSSALLRLVFDQLAEQANKYRQFEPSVLYIDEGILFEQPTDVRFGHMTSVFEMATCYGWPVRVATLESVLGDDANTASDPTEFDGLLTDHYKLGVKIKDLFDNVATLTAKFDLQGKLRTNLMIKVARKYGYTKVFTGESQTKLSVKILSDISQGQGIQLASTCVATDGRFDQLTVIRPMRDISDKEISFFNQCCQIQSLFLPNLLTKVDSGDSIQSLTESFILGLQKDFPATLSTVYRVSSKLGVVQKVVGVKNIGCRLCAGSMDDEGEHSDGRLCYGCRLIEHDVIDCQGFEAAFSVAGAKKQENLKSEIEEYLISDD